MTWLNRNHTLVYGRRRETIDRVDQVAAAAFVSESGHVPERDNSILEGSRRLGHGCLGWEVPRGRADH